MIGLHVRYYIKVIAFCLLWYCAPLHSQFAKKYWVYFTDKGPSFPVIGVLTKHSSAYMKALEYIHPRALTRRAKVRSPDALLDAMDLPVYEPYVQQVSELGGKLSQQSRWMNAASFFLTPKRVSAVAMLSFVKGVEPVKIFHINPIVETVKTSHHLVRKSTLLDYGPSFEQNQMVGIIELHDIGITGRGVLIGMLDSGFRWRAHEALQARSVLAEYDFIFHDDTTSNQWNDVWNQDHHGTLTMSVVGGYKPGQLIGPAFNADFILAKTEDLRSETSIEEDNWAVGIEWMEGLGIDVASSSLGYNIFDDGSGYTWANGDFDGRTSVTARAAVRAASLGVIVCTSMGNESNGDGIIGTLLTPADADSIISIGAINFSRQLAGFSSTGPTNDGRIKPDLVAPGVGIYYAALPGPATYSYAQGTSLSTPLVAGAAALLLSARPELVPLQVLAALRGAADPITDARRFPTSPNNFTGWGCVDAFGAALLFGPIFSNRPLIKSQLFISRVTINVISKFGIHPDSVILYYSTQHGMFSPIQMTLDSSMFFPTSGRYSSIIPLQPIGTQVQFYIEASDSGFHSYRSPAASSGKLWQFNYGITEVVESQTIPSKFDLRQNYPNPFNPLTIIRYDIPIRSWVNLKIYDVLGREIVTLVNTFQEKGNYSLIWDGSNFRSGVYYYRLTTPTFVSTKKMMLIR